MISLTIPVEPRPMPRPHAARTGGVYHPAWLKAYREEVQAHIMLGTRGHVPYTGPLKVGMVFTRSEKRDRRKDGDFDNYEKLLADCCNGLVWKDDRQVREWTGRIIESERPCIWLQVRDLTEPLGGGAVRAGGGTGRQVSVPQAHHHRGADVIPHPSASEGTPDG